MTENEDFYRLTFSQRAGKASLPEPMRLEYISKDFRNLVWLAVGNAITQAIPLAEINEYDEYEMNASIRHIVLDYTIKILHWPHDQIDHSPLEHYNFLRKRILEENYDIVLTLVEFILRHDHCSQQLRKDLENAFKEVFPCYLPTIVQTINSPRALRADVNCSTS